MKLKIDSVTTKNVIVKSVNVDGTTVHIKTKANNGNLVDIPTTTPPKVETPTKDREPTNKLAYAISQEEWKGKKAIEDMIKVPANGGVVSSRFTTANNKRSYGNISFSAPTGEEDTPSIRVWISKDVPNGPSVEGYNTVGSFVFSFKWFGFQYKKYGMLEPNTVYYMNLAHTDKTRDETSYIKRTVINVKKRFFSSPS